MKLGGRATLQCCVVFISVILLFSISTYSQDLPSPQTIIWKVPPLCGGDLGSLGTDSSTQGFRACFREDGILILPLDPEEESWNLGLSATSQWMPNGTDGVRTDSLADPHVYEDGGILEYDRGGIGERYWNTGAGLRQEIILPSPHSDSPFPAGISGISFALSGTLVAEMAIDGSTVLFTTSTGRVVLALSLLDILDDSGAPLHGQLEIIPGHILIWVDSGEALNPLHIHALLFNPSHGSPAVPPGAGNMDWDSGRGNRPAGTTEEEWDRILALLPGDDAKESTGGTRALSQDAKFYNSTGGTDDYMGYSVAMDAEGEWAVIGAYNATVGGKANHGYAYLFNRKPGGGQWSPMQMILPSDGDASWLFGQSVAISGDVIAIGAPGAAYNWVGKVYLYYRNTGGANMWGQQKILLPADWGNWDNLGNSIALDGETLVVGARLDDVGANGDQGSAVIFSRNWGGADNWGMVKRIVAPDGAANDQFGYSVAVDRGVVVVGSPYSNPWGQDNRGMVYMYFRNHGGSDNWGFKYVLHSPDGTTWDLFGCSVALSGDTALIGALSNDAAGSDQGAAYLFRRNQGGADNWGFFKKLLASDGTGWGHFGYSVALIDGMALVGGDWANAAYLFSQNQGGADNWGQIRKLTASDAAWEDFFGCAVALQPGVALVGAYGDDIGVANQGSAYLFRHDDGWAARNTLTAYDGTPDPSPYQEFGRAVAISGDIAAVGSRISDGSTYNGAVYLFYRNQGGSHAWNFVRKITVADFQIPEWQNSFGYSVALDGDILAVGDPYDNLTNNGTMNSEGSVYLFYRNQGGADNWGQVQKIWAYDPQSGAMFGSAVAMDDGTLVVGAPLKDTAGTDNGCIYIHYRNQGGPDLWGVVYAYSNIVHRGQYGTSVAISGDTIAAGAPNQTTWYTTDPGRIFIHRRNLGGANVWGIEKQIEWPGSSQLPRFGYSVAVHDDLVAAGCVDCNGPYIRTGSVFIFQRNQGGVSNWGQVTEVWDGGYYADEHLGYALAMEGDRIVAGAYATGGSGLKRTCVFTRHFGGADAWGHQATLTTTEGHRVAISGRTILTANPVWSGYMGMARLFYNHAPLAANDSYYARGNTALTVAAPGVKTNDSDQNGDGISSYKDTDPAHGAVNLNTDGSFTYTPTGGYCGPDNFTYHLSDGVTNSDAATVSLQVIVAAPTNFAVTDTSPCAYGLTITFTPGPCATRHDLYIGGGLAVTGITSGYVHNPGNSAAYNYRVRAVDAYGYADTADIGKIDVNDQPGPPSITIITDEDDCAQSGIHVNYTAGSGATSHNLLQNSVVVVYGYASGALYNPGNTNSYTYSVRAVKGSCAADSAPADATDASNQPGTPAITGITDEDPCAQSGIRVNYTAGSGATSHNLLRDGAVVVTGYASGALYDPGNTNSYTYAVRAFNGSCTAESVGQTAADVSGTPGVPAITDINDENPYAQSGIRVTYTAGSGAERHDLLRDGVVVVTGYASDALYNPGSISSYSYSLRAANGTCIADSGTSDFSDAASTADLGLSIADDPDPVCVDSTLTATFTASNAGPGTAGDVRIDGTLPASLDLGLSSFSDDDATDFGAGTYDGTFWDGARAAGLLTVDPVYAEQWELPDNQQNSWIDMTGNVLLFHMNESSGTLTDASGNGNTGTPYNGVTYGNPGRISTATGFDGNNDYAMVNPGPAPTGAMTIAAWVWIDSYRQWASVVERYDGESLGCWSLGLDDVDGQRLMFMWDNPLPWNNKVTADSVLPTGRWVHVAVASDGANATFYVDGVADGIRSVGSPCTSGSVVIGANLEGGDEFFDGRMDEVAVWTRELSEAEIQTIYNRQAPHVSATFTSRVFDAGASGTWTTLEWTPQQPYDKELPDNGQSETGYNSGNADMTGNQLLLHMNEDPAVHGTTIADASGQGRHGTLSTADGTANRSAEGKLLGGIDLDGIDDYIQVPSFPINAEPLTAVAWVYCRNTAALWSRIFDFGNGPGSDNIVFALSGTTGLPNITIFHGGTSQALTSSQPLPQNQWAHLAAVINDSGQAEIYLNGVSIASGAMWMPNAMSRSLQYIGRSAWAGDAYFNGIIDEFALYNRTLSPVEINDIYLRGAARLKLQARTCDDDACAGESFTGPLGTAYDFYSELDNLTLTSPVQAVRRQADGRWFQYRAILEFDASDALPKLRAVTARHASTGTLTATQGTCGLAGLTLLCDLGSVVNGVDASATVTGIPTIQSTITHTGTVSSGSTDPIPGNDDASEETEVGPLPTDPPTDFEVTDDSNCAYGLTIWFTEGYGAMSHDLIVDGSTAIMDIFSGDPYDPGDGSPHTYKVRAINECSQADSTEIEMTDVFLSLTVDVIPDGETTVGTGSDIVFTASVMFSAKGDRAPWGYQWTENGSDIQDANGSTYTANKPTAGSFTYNCRVTSSECEQEAWDPTPSTGTWVAPPPEVGPGNDLSSALTWSNKMTLTWPVEPAASLGYKLYRGVWADLPLLLDGSDDSCTRAATANANENTAGDLTEDPGTEPGKLYWYLVVGVNVAGEGTAGNATSGPRIVNSTGACP